jgi:hypothetical protein
MASDRWLSYFLHNRTNRIPIPWERGVHPEPCWRVALITSLQRFQVGETGKGMHLMRGAQTTGDATYVEAMRLFIEEENEHARLLAKILTQLDAPLLEHHWSAGAFIAVRHVAGLRAELLVLLVAEMLAKRYYRALCDGGSDEVLRAVFTQIIRDENGHVAFHCDTLRQALAHWPFTKRRAMQIGWRAAYRVACLLVLLDHRDVLRACGLSPLQFWRECGEVFDRDSGYALGLPAVERVQAAASSQMR